MASDEIGLQLVELIGRDPNVGELSEPGVDAVNRLPGANGPVDYPSTFYQRAARRWFQADPGGAVPGNADDLFDRERLAVENAGW
jgi:hypothetical protein